jgi:crotonobetainyl-CoA:carnitine CoA-transferase CaiB-like acyl-CoA transferase
MAVGALDGIRVIDFGHYIAGPLTAQLLADQGADVIHIDPPDGPAWQTPANAFWNRGKRSLGLDLKHEADREIARRLVATADVAVENFRPGVMDRLGLGASAMTEANPALVFCSLPGFAEDDPRAGMPAWEGVLKAATGAYRRNREGEPPGPPVYTPLPIPSTFAAIQAAAAITLALAVRDRDGVGQRITVPLFDAMFAAIGYQGMRIHNPPPRTGAPGGAGVQGGAYLCKDGRWVYFGTGNGNTREVLDAMGVEADDAAFLIDRERVTADPDRTKELQRHVRELFTTRTAEEWEAAISDAGGECAVCREASEWLRHPAALEAQIIAEVHDPVLGKTRQPGLAVTMSATPGAVRPRSASPDADRADVLADLGSRNAPAARANDGALRAALDGVKVLDLCIVLAGPTCGRTLAEYGADVIKVEAPTRPPSQAFHLDVDRGKRSIVIDLKRPEGQEVFWRLVDDADVVIQNFRNGVAERLGVGYAQVRARRPDIVYASLNMYGQSGSLAARPGHEQFAQAATGMQARYGGAGSPQLQRLAVTDYGTGYLGAYGVALALLHRRRTGEGQHFATGLAHTATLLQSPFMVDYPGVNWDEPRGQDAIGDGPLHRAYAGSDAGWFFIGARPSQLAALAAVEGLHGIDAYTGLELESALFERFRTAPVAEWVRRLTSAGIAAHHYVHDIREVMDGQWSTEHSLSITRDHDGLGLITHTGPAPRLSRTPVRPGRSTPEIGGQTAEILTEAGLAARAGELAPALVMVGGQVDAG